MTQHDDPAEAAARLLRETLRERADLLDGAPLAAPATRPRRRAGVSLIAVAAAAVVAVLAVGGVAAWRGARPEPITAVGPSPSTSPTASTEPGRAPAGWKPVASMGMEIFVPAEWKVTGSINESCDVLSPDLRVVSRPIGAVRLNLCGGVRRGTLVTFVAAPSGGKAGLEPLADGLTQVTWLSPTGGAVVASGPDAAVLQQVVATARAVDVDSLGCPTTPALPAWDRRREGLPPVRLASDVTEVVACVYTGVGDGGAYRMVAGARFDEAQRSALAQALSRAPAGAAPDVSPETCLRGRPEDAFGVLRIRTSAGPSELTFHWDGCIDRYVAGPDSQSAVTQALLATVMKAVNISYSFNGPLPAG